ncbi:hypothetical protein D0T84_14475 [Dysgonomonas sp. 521]|uniref:single-stranded DNA-binding protein n=1 Tax=Dysgonomonas sp. 521 TaxID=2302932 RepID=UPI0013D36A0E|nr:single-stranded DNA-binding protein [Dysgonomonas sp. 521]NDV96108.1 hypothetical protein [Dysgonomonas sp. 521]
METIILMGNLIEDAQAKSKDDKDYLLFTLAVDDKRDRNISRYYSCILYGANRNRLKYLIKGAKVSIIGEFTPSIYQQEGREPVLNLNVRVDVLEFVWVPKMN